MRDKAQHLIQPSPRGLFPSIVRRAMWPFKKRKRSSIEEFSKDSFDSAMRFEKAVGLEDNLKYTPIVTPMTVDQILREAFKRIHDEHRVALKHVYFGTIDSSSVDNESRACAHIQIEGDTLSGDPVEK